MDKEFKDYMDHRDLGETARVFNEATNTSSYSIEVNYRSEMDEVMDGFAKIALGYTSAALKRCGYHCKTIFSAKPYRILVGARDWDDGEWVAMAVFDHKEYAFIIAEGSYNKDRRTVSVSRQRRTSHKGAADITKDLRNLMEDLKRRNPIRSGSLVPAPLKRGPKSRGQKAMKTLSRLTRKRPI